MKKKVKFGRDLDETSAKDAAPTTPQAGIPISSLTDVVEPCTGTTNFTLRLKIPKGTQVGDTDAEDDESVLPYNSMRATMLANYVKKHEISPVDTLEATCQIEGCTADLSCANGYFRRNKVCQNHFKAFKVDVGDFEQRFCQQCNKFHVLAEFDEDKRSCRLTLAGHNNRRKRSQPEATSVLSTGTLVYLPGKVREGGKNLGHVGASACEDLERTITNEETSDSENNLKDDASSGLGYKEKSCFDLALVNSTPGQVKYIESIGKAGPEKLGHAHLMKDKASSEPMSNASTPASKSWSSKNSGIRKRNVSQLGHTIVCQVEGCMFDLSNTKDYFKRRKVCELHFKALKVKVQNVDQRFCQQCSRFHVLAEFDEGRKSCKKMLMGHNMRRRKGQAEAVCKKALKEERKEDSSSLKTPQSLSLINKPSVTLGFETCREKTPALTN